jgi:uncharacterized membrane protein
MLWAMARPQERRTHDVRIARLRESARTGLWFLPAMIVTASVLLSMATVAVDRWTGGDGFVAFSGGPNSAQQVLTTIAASTMTFTGLVFSITIVALQLASSQFSPRVLRSFLRDRGSQVSLGVFVGTFVYALLVLRAVRVQRSGHAAFVPGVSITLAYGLALASLAMFVYFVNHIAQSIRVVNILEAVARETRDAIDANYPHEPGPDLPVPLAPVGPTATVCLDGPGGAVVGIDERALVDLARDHDCVLRIVPGVGDFVPSGGQVFRVSGTDDPPPATRLLSHVGFGSERTMYQDVAFGIRQMVDIAERALSPAVNDPTTAVQAIDRIHDVLRRLAVRPTPPGIHLDDRGAVRLVHPVAQWGDLVGLGFDEIRLYGSHHLQVARRLRAALEDLADAAPEDRQEPLARQLELLGRAVERAFADQADRNRAGTADDQGLGG